MKKTSLSKSFKMASILPLTLAALSMLAVSAFAAICVQNFTEWTVTVEEPPVTKYEGQDDADTDYLTVDTGNTFSNSDSTEYGSAGSDTFLTQEQIEFTCFRGDRVVMDDVLRLVNTTGALGSGLNENWYVTLSVEPALGGTSAITNDGFTANADIDADIWLGMSEEYTYTGPTDASAITQKMNISAFPGTATAGSGPFNTTDGQWENDVIQLEVVDGVFSDAVSLLDTELPDTLTPGFLIGPDMQRQIGLVADCSDGMIAGEEGTFLLTVNITPVP